MTGDSKNSLMFLAYHIRSSFLLTEAALSEALAEWDLSLDQFYVLRCDWKPDGTSLDEISAHAMQTKEQALNVLEELIAKANVIKNPEGDFYSLLPEGAALRMRVLQAYRQHLSKVGEGVSQEAIDVALSALLTVQNNIQPV